MTHASTRFVSSIERPLKEGTVAGKYCELAVGSAIDRFRVVQEIGRGGQGVVYEASDTLLGRDVALKTVLTPRFEKRPADTALNEAHLLSLVDDPHVVAIFDLIRHTRAAVLVMELVRGPSLDELGRAGSLSVHHVSELGAQLAAGLHALHRAGIVHGDIKPANLRLSSVGVLKILDLGIAHRIPECGAERLTLSTQVVVGTIPYMSPEQLGGVTGDLRSDIWSAGAVLYELATGRRAFGRLSTASRVGRILNGIVPRPRELRPEVPAPLDAVIVRAMSPDPGRRYQSAHELLTALHDAFHHVQNAAAISSAQSSEHADHSLRPVDGPTAGKATRLAACCA